MDLTLPPYQKPSGNVLSDDVGMEATGRGAAGSGGTGGGGTHHDHHVPPATLVELLHHGREVSKAILIEGEVPPGVHVVQVIPLDVLPQHRYTAGGWWPPPPCPGGLPAPPAGPDLPLHSPGGSGPWSCSPRPGG